MLRLCHQPQKKPDQWAGLSFNGPESHPDLRNSELLFDLPRRVVRDVYRERAFRLASRCVNRNASKWLSPGDTLVLASATRDDVGAAIHFRLSLVEVSRIESREHDVAVGISQGAGTVDPFLITRLDAHGCALRLHLVEKRLTLRVFGWADRLQRGGLADAGNVNA